MSDARSEASETHNTSTHSFDIIFAVWHISWEMLPKESIAYGVTLRLPEACRADPAVYIAIRSSLSAEIYVLPLPASTDTVL